MFSRDALAAALADGAGLDLETLAVSHPALFSQAALALPAATLAAMRELVAAIETVVALPEYRRRVLAWAPPGAGGELPARSVFFGYDFHLVDGQPRLIEINTNAGGGMLNACLLRAHGAIDAAVRIEEDFVAMFREEWRLSRGDVPLTRIAIVDEKPAQQYLAPEFELFRRLFERHGIAAVIADPADFTQVGGRLQYQGCAEKPPPSPQPLSHEWERGFCPPRPLAGEGLGERAGSVSPEQLATVSQGEIVDLIYNRLTDFSLDTPANAALRAVFAAGGVVVTPHPFAHALYADKRNLMLLSDPAVLDEFGVPAAIRATLLAGVPRTVAVRAEEGERFWAERKRWFFKPAAGFGSRAAYRGDKLTRRVFEDILQGGYIAQEIAPPSEHPVPVEDESQTMKADIRAYVYQGYVQLFAARLYQGQTTNFRTPGGGFAPVFSA